MISRDAMIVNKLGLHARAATKLVNCASSYESEVWLQKGERRVNGKSIMGVLTLAASRGTELTIETDGRDEAQAIDSVCELIADRFGEED